MKIKHLSVCIGISTCILSFLPAARSDAAFYLYLNNGGRILTSQYRYENKQIFFKSHGGEMSIAREDVQRIEKADPEDSAESPSIKKPSLNSAPQVKVPETKPPQTEVKAEAKQTSTATQAKSKESSYMIEFAELQERSGELQGMTRRELHQFAEDLISFRNKVLKNRRGHIYNEEIYQIVTMLDQVEETIKAKNY